MTAASDTYHSETHTYTVVRELGRGGQGRTLLVRRDGDSESDPGYVLKLLRLEHVDDWKQVELFEREVTTLEALEHPGIPRLVDRIVEDGRTAGIVSTFVAGKTVAAHIAEGISIPGARFERVLRDGLDILAYLRGRVPPVLHRDINPANVILAEDRAWLIDFGAVKIGTKTDMTSVGTFGYMAPEHLVGRATAASDMYGLGMTLVALAEGCDVGDLPVDDATGRVETSAVMKTVDPRVRAVVLAMVEPGLERRLADPTKALAQLDAPPPVVATTSTPARVERPQRSRVPATVVAVGVAAVAASAGMYLTMASSESSSASPEPVHAPPPQPVPASPPSSPAPPPIAEPPTQPASPPKAEVVDAELTDDAPQLKLDSTPPGAKVYVDGIEACTSPCTVRVAFGRHDLRFVLDDARVDRNLNVLDDTNLHVSFDTK